MSGKVERVERHLRRGLTDTLGCKQTDSLTGVDETAVVEHLAHGTEGFDTELLLGEAQLLGHLAVVVAIGIASSLGLALLALLLLVGQELARILLDVRLDLLGVLLRHGSKVRGGVVHAEHRLVLVRLLERLLHVLGGELGLDDLSELLGIVALVVVLEVGGGEVELAEVLALGGVERVFTVGELEDGAVGVAHRVVVLDVYASRCLIRHRCR